jgi:hypothetical protein
MFGSATREMHEPPADGTCAESSAHAADDAALATGVAITRRAFVVTWRSRTV